MKNGKTAGRYAKGQRLIAKAAERLYSFDKKRLHDKKSPAVRQGFSGFGEFSGLMVFGFNGLGGKEKHFNVKSGFKLKCFSGTPSKDTICGLSLILGGVRSWVVGRCFFQNKRTWRKPHPIKFVVGIYD